MGWRPGGAALVALATAALAPLAHGAVTVPASGWNWSNGQPQGRTVTDLAVADATHVFAAGEFGALLSSADAGASWSGIHTGSQSWLTHIVARGSTVVVSDLCDVWRSSDSGATLTRLAFRASLRACSVSVSGLAFPTPTSGLILLSDGTLFGTDDGGATFSRRAPVPGASIATPANHIAASTATSGLVLAVTASGSIVRSTDSGITWAAVHAAGSSLLDVTFADATTAYAVGVGPGVFKSTDAGLTWSRLPAEAAGVFLMSDLSCVDANTCLAAAGPQGVVRTTDGGATFTVSATPVTIDAVGLLSTTRAVAAGEQGAMFVSDDAGATWRRVGSRLRSTPVGLRANPDGFAYAWGAAGTLATSGDGGATWREPGVATAAAIRAVSFADRSVGFAVDRAGAMLKTANGGTSWQIIDLGSDISPIDVFAPTPDRVVVLGLGGKLARSTDGGRTWTTSGNAATRVIARRGERSGATVALYGQRAIAITTNGGGTWRIVNGPTSGRTRLLMRTAHCPGALTCWAVTTTNRVFRTVNAGARWTELTASVGKVFATDMRFANRNAGYLVLGGTFDSTRPDGGAWLLRTGDGGATWSPQQVSIGRPLKLAGGGGVDFALDGQGELFTTTTAGRHGQPSRLTLGASSRLVRPGTRVTISGTLTPAKGGERIVIATSDGRSRAVTAAANGRFSTTLLVTRGTSFVAHWAGDAARSGAGSRPVAVRRR